MKKIIVSLCLIAGISSIATAQLRLNAYGAYVFNDGIETYNNATQYANATVEGGFQWGFGLEYMVRDGKGIEFKYVHQDANVPVTFVNGGPAQKGTGKLGINYYMFGGSNYFKLDNEKIEPYLGAGLGWASLNNNTAGAMGGTNKTAFAWNLKGGTNIWFSKKVGLKLDVEFLSAVAATGGAYFWSYWGPVYATTYTSLNQFSLGGGLVFKLGK
jgi:outer membrane protein W